MFKDNVNVTTAGEPQAPSARISITPEAMRFWYADDKGNMKVDLDSFRTFLIQSNIGWYRKNKDTPKVFVQKVDHILKRIFNEEVVELATNHAYNAKFEVSEQTAAFNAIIKNKAQLFCKEMFSGLPFLKVVQLSDTGDAAFFCYRNTVVSVTRGGLKSIPYEKLGAAVFEDDIIDRDFDVTKKLEYDKSSFTQFLKDVSRDLEDNESPERYDRLRSILGYMIHRYKNPARTVAPLLRESIESKTPEGGTGKGILIQALDKMRNVVDVAGKQFSASDKFAFETIKPETNVFVINDIKRGFDFENLFNVITDDMTINIKFVRKYTVKFDDSPKFMMTSNYAISQVGNSVTRRSAIFKVSRHYGKDRTPLDKFGVTFFKGWKDQDWECFDSLMLGCVILYLNKGILKADPLNTTRFDMISASSQGFVEFAEFYFEEDGEHCKKEVYTDFQDFHPDHEEILQSKLTQWIRDWAGMNDREIKERRSSGKDYITLKKKASGNRLNEDTALEVAVHETKESQRVGV